MNKDNKMSALKNTIILYKHIIKIMNTTENISVIKLQWNRDLLSLQYSFGSIKIKRYHIQLLTELTYISHIYEALKLLII